mmetsp:Transcript_21547/g.19119  ORF Transcript_21547/g.19119 Transcript_21547/m.19119 type:complete len:159 (+) Transcript_21547:169-645(+)
MPQSLDLVEVKDDTQEDVRQSYQSYKSSFKIAPGIINFREGVNKSKPLPIDCLPKNFTIVDKKNYRSREKPSLVLAKSEALRIGKPPKHTLRQTAEIGSTIDKISSKRPMTGGTRSSYKFRNIKITRRDTEYINLKREVDITNKELNSSLDIKSLSKK